MKNKLFRSICTALIAASFLSGCNAAAVVKKPTPKFSVEEYPVVDGSTVTIPMSEALASKLLNLPMEEARQHVLHNKTHDAYVNLINGKADIIFVTGPSKEELELARNEGVAFEVTPIVSEAFVFLTGADNPVDNLTIDQIVSIYTGEIKSWKELGGEDIDIIPYQRPINSGSQTGFLELVMKDIQPMTPPKEQIIAGMGELIDTVSAYTSQPNGIGYSFYYYANEMWGNKRVKLISVNGVKPDNKTITSEKYLLHTHYYAVIRSDETKDSPARRLVDFILSEEGQALMEETGYVRVK